MASFWSIFIIILAFLEFIRTHSSITTSKNVDEIMLSKSLGFSLKQKMGKTLEDAKLNSEFMGQYQEMMRASQFSHENFEDNDDRNLTPIEADAGDEELIGEIPIDSGDISKRHRSAYRQHSPLGRRRARSQAIRRNKLNSQGLKSHMQHTKLLGLYHLSHQHTMKEDD